MCLMGGEANRRRRLCGRPWRTELEWGRVDGSVGVSIALKFCFEKILCANETCNE